MSVIQIHRWKVADWILHFYSTQKSRLFLFLTKLFWMDGLLMSSLYRLNSCKNCKVLPFLFWHCFFNFPAIRFSAGSNALSNWATALRHRGSEIGRLLIIWITDASAIWIFTNWIPRFHINYCSICLPIITLFFSQFTIVKMKIS